MSVETNISNLKGIRTGQFINGEFVASASGETFPIINPSNGQLIAHIQRGTEVDIDKAVSVARMSFEDKRWAGKSPKERHDILISIGAAIAAHSEELAWIMTTEMGKPISYSRWEISVVVRHFEYFGEALDKIYDEVAPTHEKALGTITREPYGVVGAVSPWNYPLLMPVWKIAPALAAANSVVVKPAKQTPLSMLRLAEIITQAGLPEGVLNVVPGFGSDAGRALGLHNEVDKIGFTGSTEIGKAFIKYSSESNAKSVSVEMGGKSPQVVFADAGNLEKVATNVAKGIYYNSGQVCNAGSRLIVQESIADELLDLIQEKSSVWIPNDPCLEDTKAGPLADRAGLEKILEGVARAKEDGAELLFGGNQIHTETGGYYFEPTVFKSQNQDISLMKDEIFGPVLAVSTFKEESEAISMANNTQYGLSASVWTRDVSKAHLASRALRAGTVYVNCYDAGDVSVPFGGYKQSGNGSSRDRSLHALENYSQLKMTYFDFDN
jgi:acyl-CoA reductase-like NAD-dependent aldehyde dehydrogenase